MLEQIIELNKSDFSESFFDHLRKVEHLIRFKEDLMRSMPNLTDYEEMDQIARAFIMKLLDVQLQEMAKLMAMADQEMGSKELN